MEDSTTKISPKVKASVATGGAIAIVLSALSAMFTMVTPDMFSALGGPFSILLATFVTALGAGIAAYLKSDPDRVSAADIQAQVATAVEEATKEFAEAEARRAIKAYAQSSVAAPVSAPAVNAAPVIPATTSDAVVAPEDYHNTATAIG